MKLTDLVTTPEAEEGFYPTPPDIANKLLEDIQWGAIRDVLEPSAGKGNLIHAVGRHNWSESGRRWGDIYHTVNVDAIEIDPYLRGILQYEYGGQRESELRHHTSEHSPYRNETAPEILAELNPRKAINFRIIHDDFLTFSSRKSYDLIVMNPPFSNADVHLIKAIRMQERYGGIVRCILNAETILNKYTNQRKVLGDLLEKHGADISFVDNAFSTSERKTDVRIAIVKVEIPVPKQESTIFDRMQKAAKVEEADEADVKDLTVAEFMEQIVSRFNVEVDSGIELIREYEAMKPYMLNTFDRDCGYQGTILSMSVNGEKDLSINRYLRRVRYKYWNALFSNKEFIGKLTTNIREKYNAKVNELEDYDFTLFNIQQISAEMNAEMAKGIEETIVDLFDRMTSQYSWYPECGKNVHYFNGWKTNLVHKINSKVILPVNGMFSCYSWDKDTFNLRNAEDTISDIEKVFDYLDGNMTAEVSLHGVLKAAHDSGQTRNIQCKYFDVTLFKKGTMHLKFHNQELVERFNIYCSKKKNWLPPNYGRTVYADMTAEEKAVVDGFHGDGSNGSGSEPYAMILERSNYYLSEPTREIQLLAAGT